MSIHIIWVVVIPVVAILLSLLMLIDGQPCSLCRKQKESVPLYEADNDDKLNSLYQVDKEVLLESADFVKASIVRSRQGANQVCVKTGFIWQTQ